MRTTAVPAARTVLEAAGLPEAAAGPSGQLTTAGYLVAPLRAFGPDRAAVRWCPPGPAASPLPGPGTGLARCQDALHAAGCQCELVLTASGGYLAVLAPVPKAGPPAPARSASHAVSVSSSDLALVLSYVHAVRIGGPHARPAARASRDTTAAYQRLRAAIASTRNQP